MVRRKTFQNSINFMKILKFKNLIYQFKFSLNLIAKLFILFLNSFNAFGRSLRHKRYNYIARSHCIEKGFSASKRKSKFGESYILKNFEKSNLDINYEHKYLEKVSKDLEKYNNQSINNNLLKGISIKYLIRHKKRSIIDKKTKKELMNFLVQRFSTRYFKDYKIPKKEIEEISRYAFKFPSACNRQPYF